MENMHMQSFDGFPYLVSNLSAGIFHIALLPSDIDLDDLKRIAWTQTAHSGFGSCLVLGADLCFYSAPNGKISQSGRIPAGGVNFLGKLRLCQRVQVGKERQVRLREYVAQHGPQGAVFGDISKGGRRVAGDEIDELGGQQDDGVPVGLGRCDVCGEWRGECLDPDPKFSGLVMRVRCLCDNDTRCARCGYPFGERAVNANYFDAGTIWHVPGFAAFRHKCSVFRIEALNVTGALISRRVDFSVEEYDGRWMLYVRYDGNHVRVGPMDMPALVDHLRTRGCRISDFVRGLRRPGEPKLNKLARQIEDGARVMTATTMR
jgi:hypothetical protein